MSYDASAQSLRPLYESFWSSQGWRQPRQLPEEPTFQAAIDAGVMFREPVRLDHDEWIVRARAAVDGMSPIDVGTAFLASLASRRLDLRSALGSYAVARHLSAHAYAPDAPDPFCRVCGLCSEEEQDLNVLNFERFKWGGTRRDDIAYIAFDLEQFGRAPRESLTDAGVSAGQHMMSALRSALPRDTATKVAARRRAFDSNKDERGVVMDILGVCGVLAIRDHPGFRKDFVRFDSRPLPDYHFVERAYPVCWWRAADGVDDEALREFLPQLV